MIKNVLTKKKAKASAKDIDANPMKKQVLAKTTKPPRRKCISKRCDFKVLNPPVNGKMKIKNMNIPITERAKNTSCREWASLRNLINTSLSEKKNIAAIALTAPAAFELALFASMISSKQFYPDPTFRREFSNAFKKCD